MTRLACFASLLFLAAFPARAELPTGQYAPDQLMVARRALDQAEQAMRRGEVESAAAFAAQAALDARLTWAMTDSEFLRREAAAVYGRSERLLAPQHE
jgi:hypothetical protein